MVTGSKSMFNMTTRNLHQILVKSSKDKDKVEFIEVAGVANVLEEKVSNQPSKTSLSVLINLTLYLLMWPWSVSSWLML